MSVTGFAADADFREFGRVRVRLGVVVLANAGGVALRAHEVPVLVQLRPMQDVSMVDPFVRIEMKPALPALVLWTRIPCDGERLQATVGKFGGFLEKMDGKQPGDPGKAAKAIIDMLDAEKPPFRLLIGGYAHTIFAKKLASMEAEMKEWKDVGFPTDFSPGQ